jgi:hypothetical protein
VTLVGFVGDLPALGYWHKVSYNSQQPDIVKIYFGI